MVTVNNYYNNIPVGRDLNTLPNTSSTGTTVGYQYDGLTEEDRFVQKVLQEHYDKVYKAYTGKELIVWPNQKLICKIRCG